MGHSSEQEIQRDILMTNNFTEILYFEDLKIGFTSALSNKVLLPDLNGYARQGDLIAVIGRNGIGKSTLLRTIAGLQQSVGGVISIYGRNIEEYSRIELSRSIGYISTEIIKVSNMRVCDLVSLGRYPHTNWLGRIRHSDDTMINDAILKTGLSDFKYRPLTELSDGERQRTMIAMVLAQDADIMVMDEPTAFLDVSSRFEIMHLMHELTCERNKTIVFSTHDLNTAIARADKVWLLKETGISEGAPEDLLLNGDFNTLFDSSKVRFNPEDGSFNFHNDQKGAVCVYGTGVRKYWTEKALIRAGYKIDKTESAIKVSVSSEKEQTWEGQINCEERSFSSIYDMINWVRAKNST
jgi:iron complex transport system ATP-binding protein